MQLITTRKLLLTIFGLTCFNWTGSPSEAQQATEKPAAIQASQPKPSSSSKDDPAETQPVAPLAPPQAHRIKAIEQRIDIIKEIMIRKQSQAMEAAQANQATASKTETVPELPATADNAQPNVPSQRRDEPVSAAAPTESGMPASEPELPSKEPELMESGKAPIHNPLEQFQIGTSPLNSLELANSLYVTGNYSQALKGYEALMANESVTLDQDWLRCLAANCYRVQGQVAKAEKLYRDVVSSKEKSYPADQAKWYLDHLTRKKKIQSEIELLNSELQPFQNDNSK